MSEKKLPPQEIIIRGARAHNLKSIDVNIPLGRLTAIAGVSGSGKSSLALGTLYAEGSRRYLEALSAYTRRRISQASKADAEEIRHVPAALALHQRPGIPGVRSTFGTSSELLNSLRLLFSRVGSHCCPNGHSCPPGMDVALMLPIKCPVCGEEFYGPGAEAMSFNSDGACSLCQGTGVYRSVDESTLVPDESLSIDEGAVLPWQTLMWSLMKDIARELGVRTDVPFNRLTAKEREIVFYGPPVKHHMIYQNKTSGASGEMDFTYFNAVYTVENALSRVKDEKGMKRVEKFLHEVTCPECAGTRLNAKVRSTTLAGKNLAEAAAMTLDALVPWVKSVPDKLPETLRPMAESICLSFLHAAGRLTDLGLSYLSLDRAASTLSTGERQRMQLARAVRNRTTGVLYVLDEPSIGLHPVNIAGLRGVMRDLAADGNTVVLVDHDTQVLKEADWLIEMGPGAGAAGGRVIAEGTVKEIAENPRSMIGPFLKEKPAAPGKRRTKAEVFKHGAIRLSAGALHTVRPLEAEFPRGRLTAVTGVSGSGKTTLVLESLVPALDAVTKNGKMPPHVKNLSAEGIGHVKLIDATPIGVNVRSTVATYANVHDELRKVFARTRDAKDRGAKASAFSYNTGELRCPVCDGTGQVSLDVQFLPDVDIPCPECRGARYSREAWRIRHVNRAGDARSLPEVMAMDINTALDFCGDMNAVRGRLEVLKSLGLGYLTLGEATPGLSGGEAQRLKLAGEMGRPQTDSVFVFDEPTIGLHPLDVRTLMKVFRTLIEFGATVIVIEHDLDVIRGADWIIDMGPGGGEDGGRIVACGTPEDIRSCPESVTGKFL